MRSSPKSRIPPDAIEHVLGNIGKPGVALLVRPETPEIRDHRLEEWHLSNHSKFDGQRLSGGFDGTSLHFSLTGFESPIKINVSRLHGNDAYFLESRVSLMDRAKWIADLDILKALERDTDIKECPLYKKSCRHNPFFMAVNVRMVSLTAGKNSWIPQMGTWWFVPVNLGWRDLPQSALSQPRNIPVGIYRWRAISVARV